MSLIGQINQRHILVRLITVNTFRLDGHRSTPSAIWCSDSFAKWVQVLTRQAGGIRPEWGAGRSSLVRRISSSGAFWHAWRVYNNEWCTLRRLIFFPGMGSVEAVPRSNARDHDKDYKVDHFVCHGFHGNKAGSFSEWLYFHDVAVYVYDT
jgi:hypothetical protein